MNGQVSLWVPFEKGMIDVEKRMVYGRAQTEDLFPDLQGDVVDWHGTKRAFDRWFNGIFKGNVREMHRKDAAVGRAMTIQPLEGSKEMLVGVHVSKGAESTWQKVLDGTLSGFSIGGYATRVKNYFDARLGRNVRKVLDYVLTELSLVDVPANPRCKIIGIQKNHVAPGLTGGSSKGRLMENAALEAILEMAKTVGPDAEVIIMKRSDINVEEKEVDGKIVKTLILDPEAEVSDILKGADLAGVADAVEQGSSAIGDSLIVFAKGLAELAKSAGYDPAEIFGAAAEEQPPAVVIGKGLTADDIEARVDAAVGDRIAPLAKGLDDLKNLVAGTQLAVRKNADGTEAPVARAAALGGGERGTELKKTYDGLVSKRDNLLAKMDAGETLTSAEKTEAHTIGSQIDKVEVELASLGVRS